MGVDILGDWGISASELAEIVAENPSMRGLMFGFVAEYKVNEKWHEHFMAAPAALRCGPLYCSRWFGSGKGGAVTLSRIPESRNDFFGREPAS